MNLAIDLDAMPVRISFEQPLSDDELMRFSAANEWLRVEAEPERRTNRDDARWF